MINIMETIDSSVINDLKKTLSKRADVFAVYLFGSQAKGQARLNSDLDMAIFVKNRSNTSERDILKYLSEADIKLPGNTDLVCVDLDSSPLLLYQIIKHGILISEKSSKDRKQYEGEILHRYYDNQYMRSTYRDYLEKSLKEGTYGY